MDKHSLIERMDKRAAALGISSDAPNITVIIHPALPPNHLITTSALYELFKNKVHIRRVMGGVCYGIRSLYPPKKEFPNDELTEFNEYGIAYRQSRLSCSGEAADEIDYSRFVYVIDKLCQGAFALYESVEYGSDIEIRVLLKQVFGKKLTASNEKNLSYRDYYSGSTHCLDFEVSAYHQCYVGDLSDKTGRAGIIESLIFQLLCAFNIPDNVDSMRSVVRQLL